MSVDDAAFVFDLVNEPSWLRYIGDKGVRTLDDARGYIENGPLKMYERMGFGLYLVELKETGAPIGMCGLIKRDSLADVDIGFAFLPAYWSKGYAHESAAAVLEHGRTAIRLPRVVAITSTDNESSKKLLLKLGFEFVKNTRLSEDQDVISLFSRDLEPPRAADETTR